MRILGTAKLQQPVVMHTHIAYENRIAREHFVDFMGGALGMNRRAIRAAARSRPFVPFFAPVLDVVEPGRTRGRRLRFANI